MQSVVETRAFQRAAKDAGMEDGEVSDLITFLALNPDAGEVIVGTGGARKLRWRRPGTGKSGGYRIITYFAGRYIPVFLLTVFTKGERANLSDADRNAIRDALPALLRPYRGGT